ncbi:calmodulin [Striga asiatica]|uniref:Calmodulin n=1 Tax=Striga asiatica TaxID=4170 RepID=A0A5A7PQM6_STRAF|nr:calmodulin [Striga asiatica]
MPLTKGCSQLHQFLEATVPVGLPQFVVLYNQAAKVSEAVVPDLPLHHIRIFNEKEINALRPVSHLRPQKEKMRRKKRQKRKIISLFLIPKFSSAKSLQSEQIRQLHDIFKRFNMDHDGSLTQLELAALLWSLSLKPSGNRGSSSPTWTPTTKVLLSETQSVGRCPSPSRPPSAPARRPRAAAAMRRAEPRFWRKSWRSAAAMRDFLGVISSTSPDMVVVAEQEGEHDGTGSAIL